MEEFRQPIATAIGIILGFVLGFSADWAMEPVQSTSIIAYLVGIGLSLGAIFMIVSSIEC